MKISARCAPLITDPVSWAIINRRRGLAPWVSIQTGAPSGTYSGSIATVRFVVKERFFAPNGPLFSAILNSRKNTKDGLCCNIARPSLGFARTQRLIDAADA